MGFQTPDSIIQDLVRIREEASKGVQALLAAEENMARLQIQYDTERARALLNAKGTVVDREALACLATEATKLELDLAKAQFNRVKVKLRILQDSQTSIQTQARMVELTYKTAGVGER
jgi:hypothetical protein